jgi:hypothetical protein
MIFARPPVRPIQASGDPSRAVTGVLPWRSRCVAGSTVGRLAAGRGSRREDQHRAGHPSPARTRRSPPVRRFSGYGRAHPAAILAVRQRQACRPISRKSVTPAGVTQTIVRGHFRQCGVSAGTTCNTCRVRGFVRLSGVAGTVVGHEDRLRAGVHPRPESRRPARRPGRCRVRPGIHRQGLGQTGPPPRAGPGAAGRPGRRSARGDQARPARPGL